MKKKQKKQKKQKKTLPDFFFRSEVESELDFDRHNEGGARGGGEGLCDRLELPPGVTGVESCRSASPGVDSYRGDSCGSFEFLPNRHRGHKRRPSNLQEDSIQV
jgi:hypothetical protein